MSIKSDSWIRRMADENKMIEPFEAEQISSMGGNRIISYGTSSYGYDIRCSDEFKIFTNINSAVVDPKNFDESSFVDYQGDVCIIPPNSFTLARTIEYFRIPRNVLTICLGKSTYARCGIIVNVTPFEPEWEGYVTLEFSNTTPLPAKIYANEGVAQVIFFEADEPCEVSYFAGFIRFEKYYLCHPFICIDLGWQRRCVGKFERNIAFPFGLKRGHIDDYPTAGIGGFSQTDREHVSRNSEIFNGPSQCERIWRDNTDITLIIDETTLVKILRVDYC